MAVLAPLGIQGVYVFQYVLLLVSFWLVHRFFDIPGRDDPVRMVLFHGALIAYSMFLSVKWPAAIVAFLLLVFGLLHQRGRYGLASLALLLAIHFRWEALLMWVIYLAFLLVESFRGHIRSRELLHTRKNLFAASLLVICVLISANKLAALSVPTPWTDPPWYDQLGRHTLHQPRPAAEEPVEQGIRRQIRYRIRPVSRRRWRPLGP